MKWPEPKKGIPEGHYTFTLNREPDKITARHTVRDGQIRVSSSSTTLPDDGAIRVIGVIRVECRPCPVVCDLAPANCG